MPLWECLSHVNIVLYRIQLMLPLSHRGTVVDSNVGPSGKCEMREAFDQENKLAVCINLAQSTYPL